MNKEDFSDVTVVASGKRIPAHKVILAANSPHFHELLANAPEALEDETGTTVDSPGHEEKPHADRKKQVIELNEWSLDSVMKLLEFLYTARVEDLSNSNHFRVCEVMGLADACAVVRLKNLCEEILVTKLDIENSCYLLKYSKLYNADYLRQCCFDFISENAADVMLTPGFEDLSTVPSLVLELAKLSINKMS